MSTTTTNVLGTTNDDPLRDSEKRAAQFALGLVGTPTTGDTHGYCYGTVGDAFTSRPGLHNQLPSSAGRMYDAATFIKGVQSHGNVSSGAPGVGDIGLWSGGAHGHSAIGVGNGYVVTGDISFGKNGQPYYNPNGGEFHRIPYQKVAALYGKNYVGYTEGSSQFGGKDNNANTLLSGKTAVGGSTNRSNAPVPSPSATPSPSAQAIATPPHSAVSMDTETPSGTIGTDLTQLNPSRTTSFSTGANSPSSLMVVR